MRTLILVFAFLPVINSLGQKVEVSIAKKHFSKVYADSNLQKANWQSLDKAIGKTDIVGIGEFTHGAGTIFNIRTELIKYLHEQKGFDVVLFESGIGELILPQKMRAEWSASRMTTGFFGPWRNQEFAQLMTYLQQEEIDIAGFDVQRTGGSFKKYLSEHFFAKDSTVQEMISAEDTFGPLQKQLRNRKSQFEDLESATKDLIEEYKKCASALVELDAKMEQKQLMFLHRTCQNRAAFLSYMIQWKRDNDWSKRWAARDEMMAANIRWLLKEIYPNRKVVLVAHNFHLAKYNAKEKVMGAYLSKSPTLDMYMLGVFAGSGHYSEGRTKKMATPIDPNKGVDLKHIIQQLSAHVHFLDINKKTIRRMPWLKHPITIKDTFIDLSNSDQMELNRHFDGLLLIDKVKVPTGFN